MAAAAQAVHDYFEGNVVYIDVMNNISIDCDCDGNDTKALIDRINQRHGIRILYRAEENGLGSTHYQVVELK